MPLARCAPPSLLVALALAATTLACAAETDEGQDDGSSSAASAIETTGDYARWAPLVTASGATLHPQGRVTVLGIRGRTLEGERHDAASRVAYDDVFVVLKPNGKGTVLRGSTHPFQSSGVAGVPDVDADGRRDVGRIRPGEYLAIGRGATRLVGGLPAYDVKTFPDRAPRLPGVRDTNQDGMYDEAEDTASLARGDGLTDVLFHHGDRGAPAVVGCQVLPSTALQELVRAVGGPGATFHYVLIDAPTE